MRTIRRLHVFLASSLVLLATAAPVRAAGYVWWEGEGPAETNFPDKTWFSASTFQETRHEVLSGGDWLTNAGERSGPEAFARYRVTVPAAGEYGLWCRKFWKHGPFRWRFDGGEWRTCGRDVALADSVPIRTHLCVNWVHLGEVRLAAGEHTFELRLLAGPGETLTACFDAFVLVRGPFVPRGRLKPGEKSGAGEPGWWALEVAPDAFEASPIDLRRLNEERAGESGFVRRDGDRFVRGDGRPVRFWAVNCGGEIARLDAGSQRYLARRLAKVGVNLVRLHSPAFDKRADDPTRLDPGYVAGLHRFLAALKEQGIYLELSFYFPLWFEVKPSYGIPGYEKLANKKPFALLYFDPRMQEVHRAWARGLLTAEDPHTGLRLADDPALAMIELVNEDSYFFWTFAAKNIPPVQMAKLERLFGAYLERRYGSIAKARAAWGGADQRRDAPDEGRMAVLDAWHLTGKGHGSGAKKRRMSDQLRFLTEHQRAFYEDTAEFLRRDLGAKGLVVCSNWKTADARVLGPLERYTYTAGDVIDRHGYFGGRHEGPRASYSVSVGDTFAHRAGVLEPEALPIQFNQVADRPHVISEIGWTNPNRFKAEFPFLCAAYGSLQGVDGFMFFAIGGPSWESGPRKFPLTVPTILGQFPATALAYRRGDIRQGPVVAGEALALDDLYAFRGGAAVEAEALDELRKADLPERAGEGGDGARRIDPLAFYVGRVLRRFDGSETKLLAKDLGEHVDRGRKVVRSATGELVWDYGRGLVTVDTPRTQGAAGFLAKAGRIELGDVAIESENEFGAIVVTSLDGEPVASSKRLLVQAMTEEKPCGWKVEGGRIEGLGGYPMLVRNVEASVTLRGAGRRTAQPLDPHGSPQGPPLPLEAVRVEGDAADRLKLAPDAMYTVVTRP